MRVGYRGSIRDHLGGSRGLEARGCSKRAFYSLDIYYFKIIEAAYPAIIERMWHITYSVLTLCCSPGFLRRKDKVV